VKIETINEPLITEITLEIEALMRYAKEEMGRWSPWEGWCRPIY